MTGVALAVGGAYGVYLLYTALVMRWRGLGVGPAPASPRPRRRRGRAREWLAQAGLPDVAVAEFAGVTAVLALLGAGAGWAVFGGFAPAAALGAFAATFPLASYRRRRAGRRTVARQSWPRMIEEIRLLTGSLGRSIPQALLDVGRRGPEELRPAFVAAQREWLLSTDFDRTLQVLKSRLADPTADAACETLLVAHELGATDLDRRLEALAADRLQDAQGRKDALARQAGARFARRFVLVVPLGMALAGMSVGTGRSAYQSALGQVAVVAGIAMVIACWGWAGSIMRLPDEDRVFHQ